MDSGAKKQTTGMGKTIFWRIGILLLACTGAAIFLLFGRPAASRAVQCSAQERTVQTVTVDEEHFPDAVFRAWILDPANLNGAGSDAVLTAEELEGITAIQRRGTAESMIADLSGIEYFTALRDLNVPYNALTSLDLRSNTELQYVNCSYNRLTDLKVSGLSEIRALYCEFNYLPSLDLSGLGSLETIYCRHNVLTAIDFSQNTDLIFIETFDNRLTEIDVSMLKNLEFLHVDHNRLTRLDMSGNLNLKGGGFVVRNNDMRELILPAIPGFTVYYDDFAEQDPITGYDTVEWFSDAAYTQKVTGDVEAQGQTLYARRVANDYTIVFSANGGSGAPPSVGAKYGQTVSLPKQEPLRRGYTFQGWSADIYGDASVYAAGEEVRNLAGKTQGEKITLYAQWAANKYTVRFEKGADDAEGVMQVLQAQFGTSVPLPTNAYTRTDYEFAGWSLVPNGEIYLSDRQSAYNLTDANGGEVVLYAVWERTAEAVRRPYKQQLDEAFAAFTEEQYFSEDWDALLSAYRETEAKLIAAGKDESSMMRVLSEGKEVMRSVPDEAARAEEVRAGWNAEFSGVLRAIAEPPVAIGQGKNLLLEAKSAAEKAQPSALEEYSHLTDAGSRAQAAYRAGQLIREQTDKLEAFTKVCEWLAKADEYASAAMRDVGSAMLGEYRSLLREYESMSTENRSYVSEEVTEGLRARMRICEAKESALTAINDRFAMYSEQDYSSAQWKKMLQILAENIAAAESAESEEGIGQIVFEAMEQMEQIPTKEAESADPPDAGPVPPEEQNPVPPEDDLSPQVPEVPSEGSGAWKVAVIVAAIIVAAGALALIVYFIRRKGR